MEDSNLYEYDHTTSTYMMYDLENVTGCPAVQLPFSDIYLPAFYFIIFFVGVSGNFFVIWVMCGKHRKRRLVDTFIVNLAVADLVFVVTVPLWAVSAAMNHHWPFGDNMCKLSSYIIAVNRLSNIFFLTCMSVDRYLVVVRMMDSRYLKRGQLIRVVCGMVWASSLILGVPSLVYRRVPDEEYPMLCVEDMESAMFKGLSLVTLFLTFILPVSFILFCYGSILSRLQKHNGVGGSRNEARRRHSVKMVFTIIAVFVVSWVPFNFFKNVLIISKLWPVLLSCETETLLARGLILSSCLAFLNSCANPIIYIFLDHSFRERVKALLQGCPGEQNGHTVGGHSSNSFSDSISWLSLARNRTRSISKTSQLEATKPISSGHQVKQQSG
ncbi:probable G-protein coupled receptor 25 [Brienomyrus brachyistius]|uniref:probable G-protein coupled receptor 25 n=1 Tax=Brienomyrus brachyistius TaxID=42636 RepID=UPI0020B43E9C|nr:probable G-protein coupled receptor 25 [Brienomyrus brachyistius]